MQVSGFQRFAEAARSSEPAGTVLLLDAGSDHTTEIALQRPASPPSDWRHLLGSLLGSPPSSPAPGTEARAREGVLQFRSALERQYGLAVGREVGKGLGERQVTVGDARRALATAAALGKTRAENDRYFETRLRGELLAAKFDGPAVSDRAMAALADIHAPRGARLGEATADRMKQLAQGAREAVSTLRMLADQPGASPARIEQVLSLAAVSQDKDAALGILRSVTGAANPHVGLESAFAAPEGSFIARLIPNSFAPRTASTPKDWAADGSGASTHAAIATVVDRMLESTQSGLANQFVTDAHRQRITVGGTPLPLNEGGTVDTDAYKALFDTPQLAALVSACANQAPLGPLVGAVQRESGISLLKVSGESDLISHDAWKRSDGLWCVRSAQFRASSQLTDSKHENTVLPGRCGMLVTIDYLIDPKGADGKPAITGISTQAAFNSPNG